jgi:hypothetical protein
MDRKRIVLTSMLILGVGALLNPLYIVPGNVDGTATETEYELSEVETEAEAYQALSQSEATLQCGGERPCVLERQIAEQGRIEVDGTLGGRQAYNTDPSQRQNARYNLVQFGDRFYVPETNRTGNTTVLTHRELSVLEATEHAAIPSTQTSPEVRHAVETGSVRLFDEQISAFEQSYLISHNRTVYYVDVVRYSNTVNEQLIFLRLILFATGAVLVMEAWSNTGN